MVATFICPIRSNKKETVRVTVGECRECYSQQQETTEFCVHMNRYELNVLEG